MPPTEVVAEETRGVIIEEHKVVEKERFATWA